MAEGWNAVVWSAEKDEFPYLKGMSSIVSGGKAARTAQHSVQRLRHVR